MQFHSYFIFEFVLQYFLAFSVTFGNFGSHCGDEISLYCCALERWKENQMVSVFKDGSHQRISSLARDVRDLQPGLIKDSTLMRPCVVSNQTADNSRPLATEAHPNPSIPELAEENVRGKNRIIF